MGYLQAGRCKTDQYSHYAVAAKSLKGLRMITRNLAIALIISLGVHIFGMTAVIITTPEDMGRMTPYTSVVFLGPILKKTAFDIMIENADPVVSTSYRYNFLGVQEGYLEVVAPKRETVFRDFSLKAEDDMDTLARDFLTGTKGVPELGLGRDFSNELFERWGSLEEERAEQGRKVIYRPPDQSIAAGFYGGKEKFRIKVKVLIDSDGKVKKAEPLTTTGFPRLDITASKHARGWMFEPREDAVMGDEELVVEVVLTTSGGN